MSDPNTPAEQSPDATPTEALPLADQQPVATGAPASTPATVAEAAPKGRHTRTILEVVGGVVAAGLVVVAGLVGFAVGHATADDRGGRDGDHGWASGPEAGPQFPGQPAPGQPLPGWGGHDGDRDGDGQGRGPRGMDRDGMPGFGEQPSPGQPLPGQQLPG